MRIIDVSLPIGPDLLTWPGDPAIQIEPRSQISKGDAANVSELRIGTHTGTHVDPPVHFVEGAPGIDAVALDTLYGPCFVADVRGMRGQLGVAELEALALPERTERLLLKSDNSEIWRRLPAEFPDDYVCLSPEGARWVVASGIRLVGVDFLSVEKKGSPGHPTHVELLSNGVVVVEGLNLGDVESGAYTLAVLPLRIVGGDGGPARAVLLAD
ncbi:MAG: cyclase family protein [Actinobacteria bacterium]|nr:cyclase family protein [Actinomycetota bacterium]